MRRLGLSACAAMPNHNAAPFSTIAPDTSIESLRMYIEMTYHFSDQDRCEIEADDTRPSSGHVRSGGTPPPRPSGACSRASAKRGHRGHPLRENREVAHGAHDEILEQNVLCLPW